MKKGTFRLRGDQLYKIGLYNVFGNNWLTKSGELVQNPLPGTRRAFLSWLAALQRALDSPTMFLCPKFFKVRPKLKSKDLKLDDIVRVNCKLRVVDSTPLTVKVVDPDHRGIWINKEYVSKIP